MIKKPASYLWSVRGQFARYFIVGISGVVLDIATLILLKEFLGISAVLAVILNQALIIIYIFTLNKYWSFKNTEMPHKQFVRFFILALWNYTFAVVAMYIFSGKYGFDYVIVRIGSIIIMVSWNFFLYKYWVYKNTYHVTRNT